MKYAVDRIEENIVVLENIETKEKKKVKKDQLPKGIKEGNILIEENNEYLIDTNLEKERRKLLEEKLNKLKRKNWVLKLI